MENEKQQPYSEDGIYKTFFGKHIDLSKVISISDADYDATSNQVFFEIHFQLRDEPIVFSRYTKEGTENTTEWTRNMSQIVDLFLVDGNKVNRKEITPEQKKQSVAVVNLQQEVDQLIRVWREYKSLDKLNKI